MKHVHILVAPAVLVLVFMLNLTACPTPDPDPVYLGTLMISEVGACPYTNVSSWVEVYNNSSESAQLSDFTLRTYARLRTDPYTLGGIVTFTLPSLIIEPGSYALIRGRRYDDYVNGARVVYIVNTSEQVPNWVSDGSTSGSGFVELLKSGATMDFVRFGSNAASPITSSAWSGGNAPMLNTGSASYYGRSIARDGALTDTDTAADWTSRDWGTAGGPNDVTSDTDADADGIPDSCEVSGSTFAGLPLYDWGASTGQRDIFIHIDYMNSADPACTPREEALDKVVAAFLAQGIHIHFDVGTLYTDYNLDGASHQVPFAQAVGIGIQAGKANLYSYKNTYMNLAKKQIFHYLLFGYSQNTDGSGGSSGVSEAPGNDFIVSLGNWGLSATPGPYLNQLINYQASTIMHEFGHNLGLHHGGAENLVVDDNYKPNYYSIMNYMYQLEGLSTIGSAEGDRYYFYRKYRLSDAAFNSFLPNGRNDLTNNCWSTTFIMNYSNGSGGSIDETAISESQGLVRAGSTGVDFNGNGSTADTISKDLNNTSATETLTDYNDWANINLFFQRTWWGYECGDVPEDMLRIAPDPVGDDRQEVHVETLYPWMVK